MKKMINFIKKTFLIVAVTLLFGAILAPTSKVDAAPYWWWTTKRTSPTAPWATNISAAATTDGPVIRAYVTGFWYPTLGYRIWGLGLYVDSGKVSRTPLIIVTSPQASIQYSPDF